MSPRSDIGADDCLYLLDASGFLFRAFHAMPPLTRASDGLPVGAVSGFCNMLLKFRREMAETGKPSHLAVVFDHSSQTFRKDIFPDYKANRPPPDPDLVQQFPLARDAARAFGFACVELEKYEADDLIATYARQAERAGLRTCIFSSDKDLMQLVGDRIEMHDTMKDVVIGPAEVREKFGVGPEKMIELQALVGDTSDNVPGVPGIGPKTAAALLAEYGDLDTIFARASEIKQPKRRDALLGSVDQVQISRQLVTLVDQVPVPVPLADLSVRPLEAEPLLGFLHKMEFRTITGRAEAILAKRTGKAPAGTAADLQDFAGTDYAMVCDPAVLQDWVARARALGRVAVDLETDSLEEMRAGLVGIALAVAPGEACYVPLGHRAAGGQGDLFGTDPQNEPGQMGSDTALQILRPLLEDSSVLKIGHNLKFDAKVLVRYGAGLAPFDDTMLMSYALAAGRHRHSLATLAELHLGHRMQPITDLIGKGKGQKTFAEVGLEAATKYAAEDADVAFRLHGLLRQMLLLEGLCTVYETLERPLLPVLVEMEREGVRVRPEVLRETSEAFGARAGELEAEIHELAGESFNLASPQQLGRILFEKLDLPGGKSTAGGTGYQTGADILEQIAADGHPIAGLIVDWRHLTKLKGTYADALLEHIHPQTGRVHTSFSLAGTTTGRLASSDPNLQNIPVRTEEGIRIRRAFVADPGNLLLSLDYSQIELRVLAHIAGIDTLRDAFRAGLDIHAMTAAEVFGVPVEGMDPMIRRRAKAINFGVIYGISDFGLSNQLRIPRKQAKELIDAYFQRFPGIREYMRDTIRYARDHGHVGTLFGRRVHTPDINVKGPRRSFQERAAINAPIQGTAADIIRRAMIRIPPALAAIGGGARMILQVHDELLFEVSEDRVEELRDLLCEIMENAAEPAVRIAVPVVVDAGTGRNWAEAH